MKTNYEGHDKVYKQRLAAGARGWDVSDNGYEIHQSKLNKVLEIGIAPQSGKLLELGCGAGNIGLWFAELGYSVSGIDISPTAVALANKRAIDAKLDASFSVGSVLELLEYPDNSFDFVYDSHLLHCIIGKDRQKLFESVIRVLKPGGYFLVDTMCYSELTHSFEGFDLETKCTIWPDGTATRYIGEEADILEELRSAGFKILSNHRDCEDPDGHSMIVQMTL